MRLPFDNPMTKVLAVILIFEAITCGFAIPGMIVVEHVDAGIAACCGGAVILCAGAAAFAIRRSTTGWVLAWLTQAAVVLLGLVTAWMFAIGGIFVLLFVVLLILGKRIDQGRS